VVSIDHVPDVQHRPGVSLLPQHRKKPERKLIERE
jgi:hypothetical protein